MQTLLWLLLPQPTANLRYDPFITRFLASRELFGNRPALSSIPLLHDVRHVKPRWKENPVAHLPPGMNSYRSEHPEARGHLSEALTEDTGVGTSVAGSPLPLTTGNESLDLAIAKHLQYCTQLIQVMLSSRIGFNRSLLDTCLYQFCLFFATLKLFLFILLCICGGVLCWSGIL